MARGVELISQMALIENSIPWFIGPFVMMEYTTNNSLHTIFI